MNEDFILSTDKSKLDLDVIHNYLSNHAYWAKGRSMETVKKSVENSICIGIYDTVGKQVAFARFLTDFVVIGYIMDVFVLPEHRSKGLGKRLIEFIVKHEDHKNLKRFILGTQDAHDLYRQFGFGPLEKPGNWMELKQF
jgi:GNAT superfamily N-acetyltransferase